MKYTSPKSICIYGGVMANKANNKLSPVAKFS